MKISRSLLILALGGLVASAQASVIVIDRFSDLFQSETFYNLDGSSYTQAGLEVGAVRLAPGVVTVRESETQTQTGLSGVLGGQRTGILTRTQPIGSAAFSRAASAESGFAWGHTNGVQTKSDVRLQYGDQSALNADFSLLGPGGYFKLTGWGLDQGTVTGILTLTSGTTTESATILLGVPGPTDYAVAFSAFTTIDFTDLDVIEIRFINNDVSQDSGLSLFSAVGVPVPAGDPSRPILVGLGLIALGLVRRLMPV